MKSYNNLHPQVCSLENVMAAARSAMQGKMSGHAAARFHARWKGKGTHAGVRRCAEFTRRFPYVLKCDLRRYFPSIDHEILLQRIGKTIANRQVMALIRRILETHEDGQRMEWGEDLFDCHVRRHGLPIGNLTSQFFANVHLDGFDHFVKQELGV